MYFKNYKIQLNIFIIFTIFLLFEGFFYYYSYKLSYFCFDEFRFSKLCKTDYSFFDMQKSGFNPFIWSESRLVETFQILLLLLAIFELFKIISLKNNKKLTSFFLYFLYFYTFCIIYFFLEEISWGQHYIKWETNDFFMKLNNQGETNIHNISNLFDQLPRGILTLWCGFSFLIVRFIQSLSLEKIYLKFILPSTQLINISIILLLFLLPDLVVDKFNLHPGYSNFTYTINSAEIYDFFTFNYIRLSEYHELIFAFYIYHHALFFKKHAR